MPEDAFFWVDFTQISNEFTSPLLPQHLFIGTPDGFADAAEGRDQDRDLARLDFLDRPGGKVRHLGKPFLRQVRRLPLPPDVRPHHTQPLFLMICNVVS
ncbi:hypothetical protein OpiT1DRAFT_04594 [Opitutaceae bacterium TAV1]|nr:hypothetical protein OpiT1DRAFT_04594 [Opitutaceae bacterium TAV1]